MTIETPVIHLSIDEKSRCTVVINKTLIITRRMLSVWHQTDGIRVKLDMFKDFTGKVLAGTLTGWK